MLRRPKTAEVNGKPVITLPKRNVDVVSLEFDDPSEREFYESLEELIKSNIEKASEKSESGKINHIMVLTGLMRLRQGENRRKSNLSVENDQDRSRRSRLSFLN